MNNINLYNNSGQYVTTDRRNYIDIDLSGVNQHHNGYTTYVDVSTFDNSPTIVDIEDKHTINIKIEQAASNPLIKDLAESINENAQSIVTLNKDLTNVNTELTNVNNNVQAINKRVDELDEYTHLIVDDIHTIAADEVKQALINVDFMTGSEVKTYVDEAIESVDVTEQLAEYAKKDYVDEAIESVDVTEQLKDYAKKSYVDEAIESVDVTEQLKDYAKKEYVDEKLAEIDITEQLADFVDVSTFEESEMATAQLFAIINDDLLYKQDKAEMMIYSQLSYVDRQDNAIRKYSEKTYLPIKEYERKTEDYHYTIAQSLATLNSQVNNMDQLLVNYYSKDEIDVMMEAATGVDFSNYYTKQAVDDKDTAIQAEINSVRDDINSVSSEINSVKDEINGKVTVWTGTQEQYDEITELDDKILYLIVEDE